mgnify:CR=1 FL=1
MTRVYVIYVLRQITSSRCLKTMTLGATLALGTIWFSSDQIFVNMFSAVDGLTPFLNFSWSAFLNTEWPVQFIVVLSSGLTLWLVRDIFSTSTFAAPRPFWIN